ncbi:hypothetical protein B9Z19DRAFT_1129379 [Tuber borchii]|uniref:Uncharacterized protein n=1 Tax=Tuber borchii TaxID=42251 RepID=A0A2T6ZMG0_TUBBO|nr:hypothetical protein B9Z19DRAFT_1129379 [Tuber borchii]
MDFAILVGRKTITKPIFSKAIGCDILKLVYLCNSFRIYPGFEPLRDDVVETKTKIDAVLNQASWKIGEGACADYDYENTFQRKVETPMQVHIVSSRDVAVLRSKEWFHLDEPDSERLGKALTSRLSCFIRFRDEKVFSAQLKLWQYLFTRSNYGGISQQRVCTV